MDKSLQHRPVYAAGGLQVLGKLGAFQPSELKTDSAYNVMLMTHIPTVDGQIFATSSFFCWRAYLSFIAHMEHENYIKKRSENIRKRKRLTENPTVGGQIFATSTCLLTGRSRLPPAPYFNVDTRIQR